MMTQGPTLRDSAQQRGLHVRQRPVLTFAFFLMLAMGLNIVTEVFAPELTPPRLGLLPSNHRRWESDIRAMQERDRLAPSAPGGVLFVGSSSIRLWPLRQYFPELNTINQGFGGSYLSDSLYYAGRIVIPYKPRIVVTYAGENDIDAGASASAVARDFAKFAVEVQWALPRTTLIFISMKPGITRAGIAGVIHEANHRIRTYCGTHPGLTYLDIEPLMLAADGRPRPDLFMSDGIHLSPAGYRIWSDALRPLLQVQLSQTAFSASVR
jgi:lysophospholipase L1-like esterase